MADSTCFGPPSDVYTGSVGLRVGGIFIILVSSLCTTLFPIITRRSARVHIPNAVFQFCKYFGSGVIIATAFIHLLSPGADALASPCLNFAFQNYPFAFAFSMMAVFFTFIVELLAYRLGAQLATRLAYDPHLGGHHHAAEHHNDALTARQDASRLGLKIDEANGRSKEDMEKDAALISQEKEVEGLSAAAREILGVAILEFGVIFHSIIIGITLGTTTEFTILFIVIIFHQMFEGLGLGSRLALLPLAPGSPLPYFGALAYALVTPLGMAIGLGVRSTYNGESAKASYITGTFDSVSSGILLYTGLVELLAHEFIFNEKMRTAPLKKVFLAIGEMLLGAGLMALLGRWA